MARVTRSRRRAAAKEADKIAAGSAARESPAADARRSICSSLYRASRASSSKNAGLFLRQIRLDTFAQENGISSPTLRPGQTLLDYFDADVSGRDFAHGKPDPEIFLVAAAKAGVPPERAVVFEDAPVGIQAAKAAGMLAVGVTTTHPAAALDGAGADEVVTHLGGYDVGALLARLEER